MMEALGSPIRREIVWLLWDRELPAGEIAAVFAVTPPTVSSHLASLRRAGLISMRADGNFRRYRTNPEALRSVQALLADEATKWIPNPVVPEPAGVRHATGQAVTVGIDVAVPPWEAFADFSDATRYSRWLGVPVTLEDGRFAATMEWGTRIRGHYDIVDAPELIALRWDFAETTVPLPGQELVAYMRFTPSDAGTDIEVLQLVSTAEQDEYMQLAWGFVLGRYLAWSRGEISADERVEGAAER